MTRKRELKSSINILLQHKVYNIFPRPRQKEENEENLNERSETRTKISIVRYGRINFFFFVTSYMRIWKWKW